MGAYSFTDFALGDSLQEAFSRAQEYALSQHGNDPYNGTISTVDSCTEVSSGAMPLPVAKEAVNEMWDEMSRRGVISKWQSCAAIPVAPEECFTSSKKSASFEMSVASDNAGQIIRQLLKRSHPGEMIGNITYQVKEEAPRLSRRQEEVKSRHIVFWGQRCRLFQSREAAEEFVSRGDLAEAWISELPERAEVASLASKKLQVEVQYEIYRKSGTLSTQGWFFFGLAAC